MEKIVEQTLLYDFYGELLTDRQKEVYSECIFNDLSLTEAAEEYGISRQGIHDMIRRSESSLRGYEEKLHLVERFLKTRETASEIHQLVQSYRENGDPACLDRIEALADSIRE